VPFGSEQPIASSKQRALSHGQFIRIFQRRSTAPADDGGAITARQRIADFHGADGAVQHGRGFPGLRCRFWSELHELEL